MRERGREGIEAQSKQQKKERKVTANRASGQASQPRLRRRRARFITIKSLNKKVDNRKKVDAEQTESEKYSIGPRETGDAGNPDNVVRGKERTD